MTTDNATQPETSVGLDALEDAFVAEEEALAAAAGGAEAQQAQTDPDDGGDDADTDKPAGEAKDDGAGDEGAKPGEADGDELPDFDAELAKQRGEEAKPAGDADDKPDEQPGKSLEDVAVETQQQHARIYAAIMQSADQDEIQPFLRDALKEAGLPEGAAQTLWEQKLRPILHRLNAANEGYNLSVTDQLLRGVLTPEEQVEYGKRSYVERDDKGGVKPLSSRMNAFKGVMALREKSVNDAWEAKIKSGELVTKAEAKVIREAAHAHGIGVGERRGKVASSGQTPAHSGDASSGEISDEDLDKMSPEQLMKLGY